MESKPQALSSLCTLGLALLLMPALATAQMVVVSQHAVIVYDTDGDLASKLDYFGDLELGGLGRNGDIRIFDTDGDQTMTFDGSTANITLGAGTSDGDLFLRDTDGTTSTIILNGQLGELTLGNSGSAEDGDITVRNSTGGATFVVDGATGNVTNSLDSNGLVKGWARMDANGDLVSCWNCDTDTNKTKRIDVGRYIVDFPSIGANITTRPFVCSLAHGGVDEVAYSELVHVSCTRQFTDASKVYIRTFGYIDDDVGNDFGVVFRDAPFTVVVF